MKLQRKFRDLLILIIVGYILYYEVFALFLPRRTSGSSEPPLIKRSSDTTKQTDKWIIVTSVNYPTEDVHRLATLKEWTLVVVGDTKTPSDWFHPDVHFLSVDKQKQLGYSILANIPFKSYTRKNIGYLYAIENGAKWIYDTDDDNKPYGKGLQQFSYEDYVSGIRFQPPDFSEYNTSQRVFNPYYFAGQVDMWPRGFPLQYIKGYNSTDGNLRLCKRHLRAAVQQGLVHHDSDVDAIYRILHADANGLNKRFNQFTPAVTLARELVQEAKKCLYGEVYDKSGDIIDFVDAWTCEEDTLQSCFVALAKAFTEQKFWGGEDAALAKNWLRDLERIGYEFPPLKSDNSTDYLLSDERERFQNCRRMDLQLFIDLPANRSIPPIQRAKQATEDYNQLAEWCMQEPPRILKRPTIEEGAPTDPVYSNYGWGPRPEVSFPTPDRLAMMWNKKENIRQNFNQVLILTNNYEWGSSVGLLQRMYGSFFAVVIFCGTYYPKRVNTGCLDGFPSQKFPFNYIHVSKKEMNRGISYFTCMNRVHEMGLQNVDGYVMMSDDAVYNFWQRIDPKFFNHAIGFLNEGKWGESNRWWNWDWGVNACNRTVEAFREKKSIDPYTSDPTRERALDRYRKGLYRMGISNSTDPENVYEEIMRRDGMIPSDWYYIPALEMPHHYDIMEVFYEADVFSEIALSKFIHTIQFQHWRKASTYLWGVPIRRKWPEFFNTSQIMLHPVKMSNLNKNVPAKTAFCSVLVNSFNNILFENGYFNQSTPFTRQYEH